jgi:NAD(P)H dehydrogenase (quinone)
MSKIVIVYHSGYGHTQKVAEAVAEGSGGSLLAINAEGNLPDGGWEQLAAAKTIVFGSPTYMGSVSWQFKKFADASSKPWYSQAVEEQAGRGLHQLGHLNGDKLSTLHYLFTLSQQHSMFWVGTGMMPVNQGRHARRHQQRGLFVRPDDGDAVGRVGGRNGAGRHRHRQGLRQARGRSHGDAGLSSAGRPGRYSRRHEHADPDLCLLPWPDWLAVALFFGGWAGYAVWASGAASGGLRCWR